MGAMFTIIPTLVGLGFVVVVGLFLARLINQAGRYAANSSSPRQSIEAEIVDKRIQTSGGGENSTVRQQHHVTFETASGERFELEVKADEYGLLVVGDRGTVERQGSWFHGFSREIMR